MEPLEQSRGNRHPGILRGYARHSVIQIARRPPEKGEQRARSKATLGQAGIQESVSGQFYGVGSGVYETLLDGMELEELLDEERIECEHILIADSRYTWWECGRSYLCRIIDMLNMGYVDEVLFGIEVVERLPKLVQTWVNRHTRSYCAWNRIDAKCRAALAYRRLRHPHTPCPSPVTRVDGLGVCLAPPEPQGAR
jgi:hypothetical protein